MSKPCLDQPHPNDQQIKGKVSKDGKGQPAADAIVEIYAGDKNKPEGRAQVNSDGTFQFVFQKPLDPKITVRADQISPTSTTSTGEVPVTPTAYNLCVASKDPKDTTASGPNMITRNTDATRPCLNQPMEGDEKVTGRLPDSSFNAKPTKDSPAIPSGTAVDIKINGQSVGSAQLYNDGTFASSNLHALNSYNTVQADQTGPAPQKGQPVPSTGGVAVLAGAAKAGAVSSKYTLGLFGINVTGTSSSGPSQQYFASFDLIAPLKWLGPGCGKNGDDPIERRCWIWVNPRIASLPSAATTALSSISSTSLSTTAGGQTIGQMTQSLEVQAGLEYYIFKPEVTSGQFWGLGKSWAQSTLSLIAGAGLVTPFNSLSAAPEFGLSNNLGQQFNQQPVLALTYPQLAQALCSYGYTPASAAPACPTTLPTPKPTIGAFVFPNRSRFNRDWFAGVRLRFWYFSGDCSSKVRSKASCSPDDVYPGTLDLRFGQDETVTGGILAKTVLTLTGSFPLPGTQGIVRVFGSSYMKLATNQNATPLVAVPATSFTSLDSSSVVVQQVLRSDQDYFRLGVGVDLIAMLAKLKPATPAATGAAAPAAGK